MEVLLTQLGADLSEWSWLNDGEYVTAATCREWSNRLRNGIMGLRQVRIPDRLYVGGYFTAPLAKGIEPSKELTSGATGTYLILVNLVDKAMGNQSQRKIDPRRVAIRSVPGHTKKWILSFAKFLQECGGCWQW
jgi:hypothetical protein